MIVDAVKQQAAPALNRTIQQYTVLGTVADSFIR
jgi:hypothetical protein